MHVLFVGLGGVGQRHLRNFKALLGEDLRVSAYRVRRENAVLSDQLTVEAGAHLEQQYDIAVYDDLDAALSARPDVCVVANPNSMHIPVALAAAKAGCDLFVEKPLSSELLHVDALIDVVEKKQLIATVAYQLRFHPAVQGLIAAVEQNLCGQVYGARAEVAEYLPNFHPYEDYRRMYASRKELGGGVILTQIHELDLLVRLFGLPEAVLAVGGKLSQLEVDVEDSVSSLLTYRRADGALFGVSLYQDYLGRPPRRALGLWGSEGKLDLDLRKGTLLFTNNEGAVQVLVDAKDRPRNQLFLDETAHFLQCVKNRSTPMVSLQEAKASLILGLALSRSLATQSLMPLFADTERTTAA